MFGASQALRTPGSGVLISCPASSIFGRYLRRYINPCQSRKEGPGPQNFLYFGLDQLCRVPSTQAMPNWFYRALHAGASSRTSAELSPITPYVNAIYYPNWKVYSQKTPSNLSLGFVSHVFYAFAWCVDFIFVSLRIT